MDFLATPEREIEIIEKGIELLGLTFGDFWYEWYDSSKPGNHSLDINSNVLLTKEALKTYIEALTFVDSLIDIKAIELPSYMYESEDYFKYMHRIHFRSRT